jgi:26S proteasome regulatory subunit N7
MVLIQFNEEMTPFYLYICKNLGWKVDQGLVDRLESKNAAVLKSMDEKSEDALKNLGETEYSDSLIQKANYLARIGEKVWANFNSGQGC